MLRVLALLVASLAVVQSGISSRCLNCICQVESSGCRNIGCVMDGGSLSCGPYQIKKKYWTDCGRLGSSWKSCARDSSCAARCVRAYMSKYGRHCTQTSTQTCKDYARIHNGGPRGCRKQSTLPYWAKIQRCLN